MTFMPFLTQQTAVSPAAGWIGIIGYIAFFGLVFYFLLFRPQKKQQKKMDAMIATIEAGDSILTTSGFYGVVIDVTEDVLIVEFGNNKNCRIPMKKNAVVEVEKSTEE